MRWLPLVMLLTGCTHLVWTRQDATQQQLTTDIYECDRVAREAGEEPDRTNNWTTGRIFWNCMNERQWRQEERSGHRKLGWRQYELTGKP